MKKQDLIAAHANGLKSSIHALEVQITILKQLVGGAPAEEAEEPEADAPEAEEEEEDFAPAAKAAAKKTAKAVKGASFDEDDEPAEAEAEEEEEEEDFTTPPAKTAKAAKAKKVTVDDVNDACKAKATSIGGKEGRAKVLALLKKHFKTESVSELKPEQYEACLKVMAV